MNILQIERELKQLKKEFSKLKNEDPFLTPRDVAEILKIGLSSTYTLFQKIDFPGKKIAGSYRVRQSQLYKYFDNLPKE